MSLSALIIVDELADRAVVESSLRAKPAVFEQCFATGDIASARRLLVRERVDLVLVDLDLDSSSQMISDLRCNTRYSALPLIGISYNAEEERVSSLLERGLDAFVSKPLRRDVVRAEIDEIAGIRPGQSA